MEVRVTRSINASEPPNDGSGPAGPPPSDARASPRQRESLVAPTERRLKETLRLKARAARETLAAVAEAEPGAGHNGDPLADLRIEQVPLGQLHDAERKVRRADAAQRARVRASVQRFGVVLPILIDRDNRIIHGHAVADAARDLELPWLPCVRVEHLSKDEARLLAITLNRLAETGTWDAEALKLEFQELIVLDEPLTLTGFDAPLIDALMLDEAEDLDPAQDVPPALGEAAITQPGDVWRLGEHRLACGDARDSALLERLLQGARARTGFIDPPYNVAIQGNVTTREHREFAMAVGEMSDDAFASFLGEAYGAIAEHLVDGGLLMSFMDWRGLPAMSSAARALALEPLNLIVWAKTNAGLGSLWRSQHELIGVYKKGGAAHVNNVALGKSGRWRSNLWTYPGASSLGSEARAQSGGHPTPKPVALLADALLDVTNRGEVVVDTFTGSGSTLIACERTGRRFVGIELDPLYVDLAVRRWETETGRKASLETAEPTTPLAPPTRPRVRVPAGSSREDRT